MLAGRNIFLLNPSTDGIAALFYGTSLGFSVKHILLYDMVSPTRMPIDSDTANIFFQLIAKRYEKNSTIITTNMSFSRRGEYFGSAMLANALLTSV